MQRSIEENMNVFPNGTTHSWPRITAWCLSLYRTVLIGMSTLTERYLHV